MEDKSMKLRPMKRQRVEQSSSSSSSRSSSDPAEVNTTTTSVSLTDLLRAGKWNEATKRVEENPNEVTAASDPSPLALACRFGASVECIRRILEVCPQKVRRLLDSRGTPVHEAIVCENVGPDVIGLLLKADEELGADSPRATVMQDVDGYTPIHLLIRRRFQSHVLGSGEHFMELLEMLVQSAPESVVIPDRGEYEEPPCVMCLKANVYAPLLQLEGATAVRIERDIHDMVRCMLQHYPSAASCVFSGYRGKYTALHSAVFHGRCPDTIRLLIEAEKRCPTSSEEKPGLLANTQGELPLHFCSMRGEPPRTVALLAAGAPEAVSKRDASGLTPMHWLWIRFVSTLLAIDDAERGNLACIPIKKSCNMKTTESNKYSSFAFLEQGDFEADLQFVRRVDPSVDFLRMRHIPGEVLDETDALNFAKRTETILQHVRDRHRQLGAANLDENDDNDGEVLWSRVETVASLFWTKVVSMLKAVETTSDDQDGFSLVQAAFKSQYCPPQVGRIVASMYPSEMADKDENGMLVLHHAALRPWHAWDWPRNTTSDSANAQLLELESASLLRTAMELSPLSAGSQKDVTGRLPIHCAIPTFVRAFSSSGRLCTESSVKEILELLTMFVKMNPDSLHQTDPNTGLYPFLQATAVSTEEASASAGSFPEEFSLSAVYTLLHADPSIVRSGIR
ncbi:unnamed protein product [Cylindrotheca closterium]|uniref:Uncharacterized protein n=1 Tax=Cylindrotheca closterium TaxID=2856 RepID=A0AAD2GAF5_9STRA|nr:unnamed protein product [Cylindrotheca closterium]